MDKEFSIYDDETNRFVFKHGTDHDVLGEGYRIDYEKDSIELEEPKKKDPGGYGVLQDKELSFKMMINWLSSGRYRAQRKRWRDFGYTRFYIEVTDNLVEFFNKRGEELDGFVFNVEDFNATDWEVWSE